MFLIKTKSDLDSLNGEKDVAIFPSEPLGSGVLSTLVERSPELQVLQWIKPQATEESFQHFVERAVELRALNVSDGLGISSAVLCSLFARAKCLRFLDLSFCSIDDSAFASIETPLVFLNLQGCSKITDATLYQLAKIPTLRHLLLAFNNQITPQGLRALVALKLKTLKIHGCRKIESMVA